MGEILDSAFQTAQAVIVLMIGDDLAKLRDIYLIKDEKPEEFTPQARPNVLFEAGMAFGRNPDKTKLWN
ncbi:MAG: nucleotide-binding protein [Candidatus Marinimicrobia bacterium]|nr:nucleotide-binding protein [Candidatus Neomarinimicrobiota bacterium]